MGSFGWYGATTVAVFTLAVGCNDSRLAGQQVPEPTYVFSDTYQQGTLTGKVDVLWVVDNSGSMEQEQAKLAASFKDFITRFTLLGLDFHLAVITTDVDNAPHRGKFIGDVLVMTKDTPNLDATFQKAVQVGITGSDITEEQGLEAVRLALSEPLISTHNAGFLREDAILSVIFVSDENDFSTIVDPPAPPVACSDDVGDTDPSDCTPVATYSEIFRGFKPNEPDKLHISAIAGPTGGCNNEYGRAAQGDRYATAAAATPTGVFESICLPTFGPTLDHLSEVISGLLVSNFKLTHVGYSDTVTVTVNGEVVEPGPETWHIDEETNELVFETGARPDECAEVQIQYQTVEPFEGDDFQVQGNGECPALPIDEPEVASGGSLDGGSVACGLAGATHATAAWASLLILAGLATRRRRLS